ncbi:glycosyl hydrolase [Frankia sp. ACN1ag]|uniref:glycosyl hydrolase n=1 Tax=Frankia sp. ACN1ag TaxID=102891 RepID=UPI001F451983|nr:glycosyl hydrolase [Frankia sp. ACN1ag]
MLNAYGRQDSIIRIGWEGNGDWYQWSATNPTDYVNCFRHVADSINATSEPDPTLCWGLNAHYSQNPPSHNAMDMYPGDAWVDAVGLDAYDFYPASPTKAAFDAQASAVGGLNYWYNFAQSRNKLFGVGEWGVVDGSGSAGGGDSANYVQWMYDWFTAHAGKGFAWEFYFNNCDPGNVGSNLYRPLSSNCVYRNPNAAARYRQLYTRT